jgi:hypothetical protein
MFFRKPPKQFSISVPEPCSENWNGMHVVDSVHRHCNSCAKNVVDFSQMSDDEVLLFFRNSQGNICGRFRKEQLERAYTPLPVITRPASWWKAAALLPLTLLGKNVAAQTDSVRPPDSLQVMNDTLAPLQEMMNDSAIAAVDSVASRDSSIVVVTGDSIVNTKTECAQETTSSTTVYIDPNDRMGVVYNPPIITGNIWRPVVPTLPFRPLSDWLGYFWSNPKSDDAVMTSFPDHMESAEDHEPKPDPVPPTVPEQPWYEAILPRSWRIRKS